jgi:hypothetical protein
MAGPGGLHRRRPPVHARVEDGIRTGEDCGIGKFPIHQLAMNRAWITAALTAATLIAWLKLIALDGGLALAEPEPCATGSFAPPLEPPPAAAGGGSRSPRPGPGPMPIITAWERDTALPQGPWPARPPSVSPKGTAGACGTPGDPAAARLSR